MKEEKKKVVSEFMSKNSKAQLIDKMVAAGLSEIDMSAVQRLPISMESQMEIVNHILYERAMEDTAGK
tara:strand:- start:1003 stop:1206 length:204 start_codon:yes stop_codon:yes gene_type:complete